MRLPLALSAVALVAATALPAHADYPPTDCAAALALAAAGTATGCSTIGAAPVPGSNARFLDVAVQTGQVAATLGCGGDGWNNTVEERTIVVTAPWTGSATVARTSYCWVRLTALVDDTTAVATNRTGQILYVTE